MPAFGRSPAERRLQLVLKHLRGREIFQLQKKIRRHLNRFFRNQADDFAPDRHGAVAFRFALHHFIDPVHRRLLEIRQVDRHLRQVSRFQFHSHGFDVAQPSRRVTNRFCYFVGDADVRGIQIDIVGHQKFPCSNNRDSRCRVQFRFPHIGLPVMIVLHLFAQSFKLPSPDIFEINPVGPLCRRFIEKYGNSVTCPNFVPGAVCQGDTILDRDAFNWYERNDVRSPYARVRSGVLRQVDQFHRLAHAAQRGIGHCIRLARQRDHAAVVVGVHLAIENVNTRDAAHGRDDARQPSRHPAPREKFGTHSISRFIANVSLASTRPS